MDTRPSVQSILTADTLIAHYVRAVDAVRRSLGRDELEMSAQVSDANRTYPSIWEHLDHARGLIAAGGATPPRSIACAKRRTATPRSASTPAAKTASRCSAATSRPSPSTSTSAAW